MKNRLIHLCRLGLALVLGGAILVINPNAALAQAQTLGDMTNTVYDSLISLQFFLSLLAYALGTFFTITGLQMLRAHVDDPGRNPVMPAFLRLCAAGFFILSPTVANMLVRTLGGGGIGETNDLVTAQDHVTITAGTFSGDGLDQALGRFVVDFGGPFLENLLPFVAYLAGAIFMFIGLKRMALANQDGPQAPGGMGTMMTFVVAAGLMAFGYVMFTIQGSLFGTTDIHSNPLLTNDTSPLADRANQALWAVFIFLRIVGYISVLRGLFLLRMMAEGGGNASLTAVVTHFVAGAALANGGMLVGVIQETFVGNPDNFVFDTRQFMN